MLRVETTKNPPEALLEKVAKLRHKTWTRTGYVFHVPLAKSHAMCRDELDLLPSTDHILVWDDEILVAAGRVTYHSTITEIKDAKYFARFNEDVEHYAQLGRLVVDPDFWGRGISRIVDETRIRVARDNNSTRIVLCAVGTKRCNALLKQGFTVISTFTDDCDIMGQDNLKFYGMYRTMRLGVTIQTDDAKNFINTSPASRDKSINYG